jgi:hypothetical protein
MVTAVVSEGLRSWWIYAGGVLLYILFERFLTKPMWVYVVGHELTHAVSGLISGAKIHSFKAGARGGEVQLSKTNAFIALSPYILPFYTVAVIVFYAILRRWWDIPKLHYTFEFLVGMTLAFHLSLTVSAIHAHQPDLKVLGFFLSGVLILLGNALILGLLGVTLFKKTPTLPHYAAGMGRETLIVWKGCAIYMKQMTKNSSLFDLHTWKGQVEQWIH